MATERSFGIISDTLKVDRIYIEVVSSTPPTKKQYGIINSKRSVGVMKSPLQLI
jgi:hypothetical protein